MTSEFSNVWELWLTSLISSHQQKIYSRWAAPFMLKQSYEGSKKKSQRSLLLLILLALSLKIQLWNLIWSLKTATCYVNSNFRLIGIRLFLYYFWGKNTSFIVNIFWGRDKRFSKACFSINFYTFKILLFHLHGVKITPFGAQLFNALSCGTITVIRIKNNSVTPKNALVLYLRSHSPYC